jgi:hypothetical protein
MLELVLPSEIREILVLIRGSIPLTKESGFCCFREWSFKMKLHLHHFSKLKKFIKKSQNRRKEGTYFLLLLHVDRWIRSLPRTSGYGSGSPTLASGILF